jgi:hypothetical protein
MVVGIQMRGMLMSELPPRGDSLLPKGLYRLFRESSRISPRDGELLRRLLGDMRNGRRYLRKFLMFRRGGGVLQRGMIFGVRGW